MSKFNVAGVRAIKMTMRGTESTHGGQTGHQAAAPAAVFLVSTARQQRTQSTHATGRGR